MGWHPIAARLVACVAAALFALAARAEQPLHVGIGRQPLDNALRLLAAQANKNMIIDTKLVSGRESVAVEGMYTFDEALARMLGSSGLEYRYVNERTVAVVEPERKTSVSGPDRRAAVKTKPSSVETGRAGNPYGGPLESVFVTGTHIRGISPDASPVERYSRVDLERAGVGTIPEFLEMLPEDFPLITAESQLNNGKNVFATSNWGRGEGFNLRGLGPSATLVLVDGKRMAPGGAGGSFIDISMLPRSAIEKIEILKDGASALYGSDAVAGTMNITLRKGYNGAETSARYAATTRGGGAAQTIVSQVAGSTWTGGNVTGVYEYAHQSALDAGERDYIPPQPGPFTVVPAQPQRHSGLMTFTQTLPAKNQLSGSLLYSRRSFSQDASARGFLTQSKGVVQQSHIVLDLRHELANRWQLELSTSHSMHDEGGTNASTGSSLPQGFVTDFGARGIYKSIQLRADGPQGSLPGGDVLYSIGSAFRREEFDDRSQLGSVGRGLHREVTGLFGETFVPIIGKPNRTRWAENLGLSLAARYDRYTGTRPRASHISSFAPRFGVSWSPRHGVKLRSTYSKSFRVPSLSQSSESVNSGLQQVVDDPNAPDGSAIGLLIFGGNESLKPERAKSFTLGLDLDPASIRGLQLSADYFDVDYRDRVTTPLTNDLPSSILLQYSLFAPFITLAPSAAEVQSWYNRYPVQNLSGVGAESVTVIFDNRLANISSTRTHGLEISAHYEMGVGPGTLGFNWHGAYVLGLKHRSTSTVAPVDLVGTVFNPAEFRFLADIEWLSRPYAASVTFHFVDALEDTFASPPDAVSSWFTVDAQWGMELETGRVSSVFSDWVARLSIKNLFDRSPPLVSTDASQFRYDPTHASVLGRYVALELTKHW